MISSSMFTGIAVAVCLVVLILLSILMKKLFKMKMAVAVFINIFLVPIIFALVVMVGMKPAFFMVCENGEANNYVVFGGESDYEFADGTTTTIGLPPAYGETIINNTSDTIVIERKMYGDVMPDVMPVLLYVEPYTFKFFKDLSLDYVFEKAPSTIETSSYASIVSRYVLRVGTSDDGANFYYYDGETNDGKPHGTGTLIDSETGEEWTGEWERGKLQEDDEAEYDG